MFDFIHHFTKNDHAVCKFEMRKENWFREEFCCEQERKDYLAHNRKIVTDIVMRIGLF